MLTKATLMTSFILASSFALAQADLVPTGSFAALAQFQSDGQSLPETYIKQFPGLVHDLALKDEAQYVKSLGGRCQETVRINFGRRVTNEKNSVISSFEDGLIEVESSKCFTSAEPGDLVEISSDVEFKKRAFSTLKKITDESHNYCEWTSAPTVGKSHYCYQAIELEKSSEAMMQVNFLSFNDADSSYEAPVFSREVLVSSRKMGAQTLFYVHSYIRTNTINSFKKLFAKSFIKTTQEHFFQEMEKSLSQKRTNP